MRHLTGPGGELLPLEEDGLGDADRIVRVKRQETGRRMPWPPIRSTLELRAENSEQTRRHPKSSRKLRRGRTGRDDQIARTGKIGGGQEIVRLVYAGELINRQAKVPHRSELFAAFVILQADELCGAKQLERRQIFRLHIVLVSLQVAVGRPPA